MNTERFQSRQAKAIAGAVAGFSAALVNCAIGGCEIVSLINAGVELLQVAIATAAGYLIVYWAPKNLDPPPRQQKR